MKKIILMVCLLLTYMLSFPLSAATITATLKCDVDIIYLHFYGQEDPPYMGTLSLYADGDPVFLKDFPDEQPLMFSAVPSMNTGLAPGAILKANGIPITNYYEQLPVPPDGKILITC